MGVVHITWDPVSDAHGYKIERQTPYGWLDAGYVTTPPFDDFGLNLSDDRITDGTHYLYRISSVSNEKDDSPFINSSKQGWAYVLQPLKLTVTTDQNKINLSWTDPNANVRNIQYLKYEIYKTDLFNQFRKIHTTNNINNGNVNNTYSFTPYNEEDFTSSYKIKVIYYYNYKNMDNNTFSILDIESNEVAVTGGGGGSISSYTWNSLGEFGTSTNGISFIKTKTYDNTLYTAILDNPETGKPFLYQSNGSDFNNISGTYPDAFLNNFDKIDFAVKSGTKYLAGISDSAYVFSYNGNWTSNLANHNFGYTNKPQDISIETDGNKIFAAIYTDDNNLVVKTWNHDTIWDDNANITNSSGISNIEMIQLNGKVYLYYLKSNSDYNSTLYIKHYNGSSWENDLEWTRDNLMDIKISSDGNNLYFVSNSQQPDDWTGSVFKVTSSTDAEDLIPGNEDWKVFPSDISTNSDGDIMIIYTHIVSATEVNPELAVYKNNTWSKVSGDYTNGVFPSSINHINQDFYFIYGDAQNLSQNSYPLKLKAEKLTKN